MLATLNDWRAIIFVLALMLFVTWGLLGYLVIRFMNAATTMAASVATLSPQMARIEAHLLTALTKNDK